VCLQDKINEHDKQIRADAIDEIKNAIDESNYCLLEKCEFYNRCGFESCPIDSKAETIFKNWLEQLKENKNANSDVFFNKIGLPWYY